MSPSNSGHVLPTSVVLGNVLASSAFAELAQTRRLDFLTTAGTRVVLPNRTLVEGDELRVGAFRPKAMRVEQGHTGDEPVLWNPRHGLLWAGGLVYDGRVPELEQRRVNHWLAALTQLEALKPRQVLSTM
jgi:glyoxylase-like metal-dependent hydrolase (beta-lactamase superfamily II)